MQNTDVPRNNFMEQAAIAKLADEGKLTLVWNDRRRVIQVKRPLIERVQRAGFER